MNPLQSKIEQTAKEYLSYKTIADKEAETAKKENNKEILAKKALELEEEELYSYYFNTFASLEFLIKDMLQVKTKLYNQIELVKDSVDIPKEILDLVLDYNPIYTYAILGDKKKLIDEKAYENYKQNYITGAREMSKMNK